MLLRSDWTSRLFPQRVSCFPSDAEDSAEDYVWSGSSAVHLSASCWGEVRSRKASRSAAGCSDGNVELLHPWQQNARSYLRLSCRIVAQNHREDRTVTLQLTWDETYECTEYRCSLQHSQVIWKRKWEFYYSLRQNQWHPSEDWSDECEDRLSYSEPPHHLTYCQLIKIQVSERTSLNVINPPVGFVSFQFILCSPVQNVCVYLFFQPALR